MLKGEIKLLKTKTPQKNTGCLKFKIRENK